MLSFGVVKRPPDASLRVGGELREDRTVGPFLKLMAHIRQLSNLHRCRHPMVRRDRLQQGSGKPPEWITPQGENRLHDNVWVRSKVQEWLAVTLDDGDL